MKSTDHSGSRDVVPKYGVFLFICNEDHTRVDKYFG